MKKIILFGKTSLAKRLMVLMERDSNMKVEAFCLTSDYFVEGDTFCNRPVVRLEDLNDLHGVDGFEIYLTVRYGNMNQNRAKVFDLCKERGYTIGNYIHPTAVNHAQKMGEGNIVFPKVYIADFATLGNGNVIWYNSFISSDSIIGDFNWLVHINIAGHTTIGDYCFMGNSSGSNNSVSIGNNNLIGAGVIVANNTEDNTVVLPSKNKELKNIKTDIMDKILRKQ